MSLTNDLLAKADKESKTTASDLHINRDWRWGASGALMAVLTWVMLAFTHGDSVISFTDSANKHKLPNLTIPAFPFVLVCCIVATVLALCMIYLTYKRGKTSGWLAALTGLVFLLGLLVFLVAGNEGSVMPVVALLQSTLALSLPLIFGSMSGLVCERSGVINIAIEGQLLLGAFFAAVIASAAASTVWGIIAAPIAGMLVAVLLALFTIRYRVDHIIVGVVLNMLVAGLTAFLYSSWLKDNATTLNRAMSLPNLPIPLLADIPIIGPVLFDQNILVYLMYLMVAGLSYAIFHTRWGLRTRACGEHPKAADTAGINVNLYRWRNVLLGGALAGLGGAYFTLGAGLAFSRDIAAGNGFIALAAMILGKWNPSGALGASLLFGFATALGYVLQSVNSPIPTEFLLMIPYIVTIVAVAGFVGKVRPPAMEGKPYPL